jgi:hypothetical protein
VVGGWSLVVRKKMFGRGDAGRETQGQAPRLTCGTDVRRENRPRVSAYLFWYQIADKACCQTHVGVGGSIINQDLVICFQDLFVFSRDSSTGEYHVGDPAAAWLADFMFGFRREDGVG